VNNTKLIQFVDEPGIGENWLSFYKHSIEEYKKWFLKEGEFNRPDYQTCHMAIKKYMPEFEDFWLDIIKLTNATDLEARLLSFYNPAPYVSGCSQAVWSKPTPILVRNYDYGIELSETRILKSKWFNTAVIASTDCLWGVLDGINEHGLSLSLSFGGSSDRADGFGIPIILRYILEFSKTTNEAVEVLQRVPAHMAYNITIIDAEFNVKTVEITPGKINKVSHIPLAVNHQGDFVLNNYSIFSKSMERKKSLIDKLYNPWMTAEGFIDGFAYAPLFTDNYAEGFGTMYTAIYNPSLKAAEFRWKGINKQVSFTNFLPEVFQVRYF
jgi:predicted choloylglycine hydrolase